MHEDIDGRVAARLLIDYTRQEEQEKCGHALYCCRLQTVSQHLRRRRSSSSGVLMGYVPGVAASAAIVGSRFLEGGGGGCSLACNRAQHTDHFMRVVLPLCSPSYYTTAVLETSSWDGCR